jgi:hypothetical protein
MSAALCLLCAPGLRAFEAAEHCRVSIRGVRIASALVEERLGRPLDLGSTGLVRGHEDVHAECRTTPDGNDGWSYGDLAALVDSALSPTDFYLAFPNEHAVQQVLSGHVPTSVLSRLGRSKLLALFSARQNEDHFQDRALFSYWQWHSRALSEAAAGRLGTALLLNAFGDHYLQDSFAPGHVLTPRRQLHDAAALATHDYYNRKGAPFALGNVDSLLPLTETAEADALLSGLWASGDPSQHLRSIANSTVDMLGDGRLDHRRDQELLVSLVVARSVADVLESWICGKSVDSLGAPVWEGYRKQRGKILESPRSGLELGQFQRRDVPEGLRSNPTIGLAWGLQGTAGPAVRLRQLLEAEALVAGSPGRYWREGNAGAVPQAALTLGARYEWGGNQSARSLSARLIIPVPKLDLQLGPTVRRSYLRSEDQSVGIWVPGARLELSLGLLFLGFSVEHSGVLTASGLDRRTVFSTTLTLVPRAAWFGL